MNRRSILGFLTGAAASAGVKESVKVPTPVPPPVYTPPVRYIWPGTSVTFAYTPEMRLLDASQIRAKNKGDINE